MSTNFRVGLQKVVDHSYDIEIGEGLFGALIEDLKRGIVENVSKFAIITDSKVEVLYGQALLELLLQNDFQAELFLSLLERSPKPEKRRQSWRIGY